ncbi:peptidase S8/S53 domain-containing protein [Truncatella angustata]|uniref:tripeptidyl-peptidase II n=1 Tax=Truncatella angustata TaxID=152316 RepID=A0A9P8UZ74_9PEZI|nr:peptidase S8/S53 domain-containing protein [Truncatella angustata]KAH6660863.1 peptidase S8/S53 domain-containing protein [Truncatella angustata]
MAFLRTVAGVLALVATATTAITQRTVVHEKRDAHHETEWIKRDRVPLAHSFEMRIGLTQQNLHHGYDLLMDVADPNSTNYGKHWSSEDIVKMFSPSNETIQMTKDWVTATGIEAKRIAHTASGGWLVFNATVDEAERLLETNFWLYENEEGQVVAGCDEYHIPSDLSEHIDFVYPGVVMAESTMYLSSKRRTNGGSTTKSQSIVKSYKRQNSTDCSQLVTPQCIADLYEIPPADKANPNNSMGLYERECWYQDEDLDLFFESYAPNIPQGTRPLNLSIDLAAWHYNESDSSISIPGEADLDIDVAYPIVYPQSLTVYQVDDEYYHLYQVQYTGLFNTFLDAIDGSYCDYSAYDETGDNPKYDAQYPDNHTVIAPGRPEPFDPGTYKGPRMCGVYKPTNVISMSWGAAESRWTASYQMRQCDEWMKLGLQGVTVVSSSGDSGPLATASCQASNLGSFWASNPGTCPYVTSVGATMLRSDGSEAVAMDASWASSGGFSRYFSPPAYQQSVLATYFADHDPGLDGFFNRSGRGIPDISAVGYNIAVAVAGELGTAAGTSASTPLIGAMINRINEERLAAGKSVVGFINPVLYANPGIFNDITVGNNSMCGLKGFQAVQGWDPTTGLGSVQYPKLLEVFMNLP